MKLIEVQSTAKLATANAVLDLAAQWLTYAQVSTASVKAYSKGIKRLQEFCAAQSIDIPTRADLLAYRSYLASKYQATTANLYLTAAKLFFGFLAVEGVIASNPAEHLKGLKVVSEHKKNALSVEMTRQIISRIDSATLKGARDKAMYALMTTCGLRCIEVARANVADIEQVQGVVRLRVQGKGKTQKDSAVNVPAAVFNLIQSYLAKRGNVGADAPLFASVSRRNFDCRLSTTSISRIIKGLMRGAGYDSPRLTAHSLRHTAATTALKNGATLREVQQNLRHSNVAVTQIYLHELDALSNTAATRAAEAFGI